jgi:hypothetical protein
MYAQMMWPSQLVYLRFWNLFELIVGFLGPIAVMAVCYSRLLQYLVRENRTVKLRRCRSSKSWQSPTATGSSIVRAIGGNGKTNETPFVISTSSSSSSSRAQPSASGCATASQQHSSSPVRRVTVMIFILTVVFVVCWTPYHVMHFVSVYEHQRAIVAAETRTLVADPARNAVVYVVVNIIAQALIFVSSCCNPFIYYITSRNFREFFS